MTVHIAPLHLDAMAVEVPHTPGHPNKMPFSGILTRVGVPSDAAPQGSGGKRVMLTHAAAEAGLASLMMMGVDLTATFDGHDAQQKVGVITSGHVDGDALRIAGFIYAADFPLEAAAIKAQRDKLGFSFEARDLLVDDPHADPLVITACTFTGAAILLKDKAAYTTTSLAAARSHDMTKEEFAELMKPFSEQVTSLAAAVDQVKKDTGAIQANRAVMDKVEPHAAALEGCAASMEAAGIGADGQNGHAMKLRKMAGSMRAEAAQGKMPHVYYDNSWASAAPAAPAAPANDAAMAKLADDVAALGTKLADVTAAAKAASPAPERKTLAPAITQILAKAGLSAPADGGKLPIATLDAALAKTSMTTQARIALKSEMSAAGLIQP